MCMVCQKPVDPFRTASYDTDVQLGRDLFLTCDMTYIRMELCHNMMLTQPKQIFEFSRQKCLGISWDLH